MRNLLYIALGLAQSLLLQPAYAANATSPPPSANGKLIFTTTGNATRALINNPPINLADAPLISDLHDFLVWLQPSSNRTAILPKVVTFYSNNSDFFMDHLDESLVVPPFTAAKTAIIQQYVDVNRMLQSITSTVFIAEINARAFGAGIESALQMDMRFAGPAASASSIENADGAIPGDGAQQYLPLFVNKGRAIEYIIGAKAFDATDGERFGLFNRAFKSSKALTKYVDDLAARIGLLSGASLNATKASIGLTYNPPQAAVDRDLQIFGELVATPYTQSILKKGLAAGADTYSQFELNQPDSTVALNL